MTQQVSCWLLGCLPLGAAAALVATRLGGRARSWIMPVAIAGQGLLGIWTVLSMSPPWWPVSFLLGWTLLTLALVDILDFRLPDALTLPLVAVGLAFAAVAGEMNGSVVGAAVGWGVSTAVAVFFRHWRGRDGLGQGDAKLLAAAGAWMGWEVLPAVVLVASVTALAGVAIVRLMGLRVVGNDTPIPFGPALCVGIWLLWLYGPIG